MKETTGKQIPAGTVISEGTAKPDDPIYKEGWTIHIGPLSGQMRSEAPPSAQDEADVEDEVQPDEGVMRDSMSGEEIRCPYCNSGVECQHWLAFIGDFPYESAGYCDGRLGEFRELVEKAFLEQLRSGTGRECRWGDSKLDELWEDGLLCFSEGDTSFALDPVVVSLLATKLFERNGGEEYPGSIENAPGPGMATKWTLHYAKDPAAVVDAALFELKKLLIPEIKAATSQRTKARISESSTL